MQKKLLSFFLLLFFLATNAQTSLLSKDSEISVLTIGPGTSLNDAFGHNAFRIKDPSVNLDIIFDYGRFDFEAPNFYLNFAKGKLNYSIGDSSYYDFLRFYIWQNRDVKEQVLDLSFIKKQQLYNYLLNNNKPENREYLYDFFYDNCATKIKDVIKITLDDNIVFNEPEDLDNDTFRTLIQNNLNKNSWGSLGIDVALGAVIDKKATPEEHMFLPKYIYAFFENATLKSASELSLVKESRFIYKKKETPISNTFFTSPLFIFGLIGLLIMIVTFNDFKNHKQSKWLDITLFSITGFVGVVILLLWFATDHKATHQNYNLLWAFALNLIMINQLCTKNTAKWFIKYLKLLVILLCLMVLHWTMGVQVFAVGLIPFLIALGIRYLYLINWYSKKDY